jgi:hypothetical protein
LKRAVQIVAALTVLAMCLAFQAAGANLQGLKWGFNPGDKIDYQLSIMTTSPAFNLNEGMYAVMGSVSAIPSTVNLWSDIPSPNLSFDWRWTNGSVVLFLIWLYFLPLVSFGGYSAVPIGNWSLLTKLVDKIPLWEINTTMVENSAYWGMSLTSTSSGKTIVLETSYLKSDGVLARYHWTQTDIATHVKEGDVSLVRQGLPNDFVVFLQDNLLYIGIGVVVLVLLAVACKRR